MNLLVAAWQMAVSDEFLVTLQALGGGGARIEWLKVILLLCAVMQSAAADGSPFCSPIAKSKWLSHRQRGYIQCCEIPGRPTYSVHVGKSPWLDCGRDDQTIKGPFTHMYTFSEKPMMI